MNCERCKKDCDVPYGSGRFCSAECARAFSTDGRLRKLLKCKKCPARLDGTQTCKSICDECHVGSLGKDILFEDLRKDGSRKGRMLRELGNKCQICGVEEWMGRPAPIQLDHIDGNPDNNDRSNLRLICAMCHAQTDTFAGKNVGKHPGTARQEKFKKYPTQQYRTRTRGEKRASHLPLKE